MEENNLKLTLKSKIFIFLSFTVSLILILVYVNDSLQNNYDKNWLIFYLWLINFISITIFAVIKIFPPSFILKKFFNWNELKIIILILFLALLTRIFFLNLYPYVVIGDQLRDAGLNAFKIKKGLIKDVFGFGDYLGYGNFVPLISYFLIPIFKNSSLLYRIPASLVGTFSVVVTYLLGRTQDSKKTGFVSAIFLIGSLVHLHFSRTELLIILDSFLAPLIILIFCFALINDYGFLLLGLITGFSLHFYAGIRGVVLGTLFYTGILLAKKNFFWFKNKKTIGEIKKIFLPVFFILIGFIVGLGPRFYSFFSQKALFNTVNAQPLFKNQEFLSKNNIGKIQFVTATYLESFQTYFSKKTTGPHFNYYAPLLTFPLNWFFLLGIFMTFISLKKEDPIKRNLRLLLIFDVFFVAFSNQTLLGQPGDEHRLLSVVPFINILASTGFLSFIALLRKIKIQNFLLYFLPLIFMVFQVRFYYLHRLSDLGVKSEDYFFQSVLNYLSKTPTGEKIFLLNKEGDFNFDFLHYKEALDFFSNFRPVTLLEKKEFIEKIKNSPPKENLFISFTPLDEVSNKPDEIIITQCCPHKFLPAYLCPIDYPQTSYSFFVYKK